MSAQLTTPIGIERSRGNYLRTVWALGLLALAGMLTYFWLVAQHPGPETWGLFTVNYMFLAGITQFGVVFSAIMRICNAKWPKPFYRLAELMTITFFPFAIVGLLFIYYYGRHELLFWLADDVNPGYVQPWMHEGWLLARNLGAQLVFYALAFFYFIVALRPDIHEDAVQTGPGWRRGLYRWLTTFGRGRGEAATRNLLYKLSVALLIVYALPNTILAWDFGMMLYPHWHSSVFPMHYMMGGLFAGAAFLVLLHVIVSRFEDVGPFIGVRQSQNMGVLLCAFALLWLYLYWAQFFVTWYGNLPHQLAPIEAQMYGHYAPLYWAMMICVVGIPVAALIFEKVKQTLWHMELLTLVMVVGVWINRYLIVMPAISDDHTVFSSFAEVVITAGWFASFLFAMLLLLNVFPVMSRWEIAADVGKRTDYKTYVMK